MVAGTCCSEGEGGFEDDDENLETESEGSVISYPCDIYDIYSEEAEFVVYFNCLSPF